MNIWITPHQIEFLSAFNATFSIEFINVDRDSVVNVLNDIHGIISISNDRHQINAVVVTAAGFSAKDIIDIYVQASEKLDQLRREIIREAMMVEELLINIDIESLFNEKSDIDG